MSTYNKINESEYTNKVIRHVETDPLDKRIDLKKVYSISNDEYFDIIDYEVNLIDSLRGEIFDTSDPKWSGTGNYQFKFEIDYVDTNYENMEKEYIFNKGDVIDIHVDIDVYGTVFIESTMRDNPGREWTIGEATNDRNIGYIVISEIRDIVYSIIEQRLPIFSNLGTLGVCEIKEGWVTRLSNQDNGKINEGVYNVGDNKDFLEYVYNDLVKNTKWRDASFSKIDLFGDCKSINVMISWGSVAPYFLRIPDCVEEKLKNLYGLSWKEIDKIWDKYEKHIINMILSKKRGIAPHIKRLGLDYLNESVDKKFLDKVVNNLISETKPINEKHISVITPFFVDGGNRYWILSAHRCREIGITHPEHYILPAIITNHLNNVYSLSSIEEMEYVMEKYYNILYNKYFRKFFDGTIRGKIRRGKISESTKSLGDQSKFLNKMVDYLVDTTELIEMSDWPHIEVRFPFFDYASYDKLPHRWYEATPKVVFITGIIENYGVSTDEAHFVLDKYDQKLREKVLTKLPAKPDE